MGFVTKSFRYDTDDIVLDKFFKKQKNFTSAMKYLILNYCSTHPEIEDLSIKYKEATSYAMMDQIRKIEGEEAPVFASGEIRQIASVEKRQFGSAEIRQFESIEKSQS